MAFTVTFKKHPKETGLAAVGAPHQSVDIKVNKKVCGIIEAPTWRSKTNDWVVRLAIRQNNTFVWRRAKRPFKDDAEARKWVKDNLEKIAAQHELYFFED